MAKHEGFDHISEMSLKHMKGEETSSHSDGRYGSAGATKKAFKEVHANEPKIVAHTRKKFGDIRAKKQIVAIALSKARKG